MDGERFKLRAAVYLILLKKEKVLLSLRQNTGWMDGKYSLVSGHLEGGETAVEAMIREAQEEAGIEVKPEGLIPVTVMHRKEDEHEYVDFFFICRKWQGTPKNNEPDKCDEVGWFGLKELPVNVIPNVTQAIENFQNGIVFSMFGWDKNPN